MLPVPRVTLTCFSPSTSGGNRALGRPSESPSALNRRRPSSRPLSDLPDRISLSEGLWRFRSSGLRGVAGFSSCGRSLRGADLGSLGLAGPVGRVFGPLGTLTVTPAAGGPVTFSAGGRCIDQDGDATIGPREGENAAAPNTIISARDAYLQTTADWMQLVRVIQAGVDVDGDGERDLDPARISYFGNSWRGVTWGRSSWLWSRTCAPACCSTRRQGEQSRSTGCRPRAGRP